MGKSRGSIVTVIAESHYIQGNYIRSPTVGHNPNYRIPSYSTAPHQTGTSGRDTGCTSLWTSFRF